MSFILDALKKSESDRQRQSGPALFEVKVAAPRARFPLWAVAVAILLVVNLVIVAWMLLRHPAAHAESAAAPLPAPAPPATTLLPAPASAPPAAQSQPLSAPVAAVAAATPAAGTPAPAAAGTMPPALAAAGAVPPAATPGASPEDTKAEDLAPAAEPPPPLTSHVRRGTADGVPLYQDWAATPGTQVPQLRLDLHVYAAQPQERFVMINMHKLREGDALPEGPRVESITPEGAVLSYNGSRFLLPRD